MSTNQHSLIDYKLLFFAITLLLFNIVFVKNAPIMGAIAFLEIIFLFFVVTFKGNNSFLLYTLVFATTSFDVANFTGADEEFLYSITNLPFIGFLGFFALLLLSLFLFVLRDLKTKLIVKDLKLLFNFALYVIVAGTIVALICFIINDNEIPTNAFLVFFKNDLLKYVTLCTLIIIFILTINNNKEFSEELKSYLFTLLVALIITGSISHFAGFYGTYVSDDIILMPLSYFYSTSIILFLFDKEYKSYRKTIVSLSILAFLIQFIASNALGGKSWLVIIFILIILLIKLYRSGFKKIVLMVTFALTVIVVLLGSILIYNVSDDNLMLRKISEAFSLLNFANGTNYYENIADSPKNRIDEFINVFYEFKEKPFFSIFGKGFGGSIKDHNQLFGLYLSSFYTDTEYFYNAHVFLHESINVIWMKFGFIGLSVFATIVYKIFKSGFKNPWISVGLIWFFFFFGYTYSLGIFGLAALTLGLFDNSKNEVVID